MLKISDDTLVVLASGSFDTNEGNFILNLISTFGHVTLPDILYSLVENAFQFKSTLVFCLDTLSDYCMYRTILSMSHIMKAQGVVESTKVLVIRASDDY